jgi:hypothetical protein
MDRAATTDRAAVDLDVAEPAETGSDFPPREFTSGWRGTVGGDPEHGGVASSHLASA